MKIIIANNDIGAMLKAADSILKKHGGKNGDIPEHIKGQTTLSVLKNMTQSKSYFSILSIDALAKSNDVIFSQEHSQFMNTLHCVDWNEMHADTREYLMALLVDYFKGNISMSYSTLKTE